MKPTVKGRSGGRIGLLLGLAGLVAAGCATTEYSDRAGNVGDVVAAVARMGRGAAVPANRTGHALTFVATSGSGGPRLVAFDLSAGRVLWTQAADLGGRVEVGSDVIVHAQRRGSIAARDIGSGAVLWEHAVPGNERLMGYAVDGGLVALVVQQGAEDLKGGSAAVLGLDARSGAQRWRHDLRSGNVGAPAARGGVVAVLMQSQYVVLLDGADGHQLAEVLSSEEAATFVDARPEGFLYGSRGVFLLSGATARGARQSGGYAQAKLPKFVRPFYHYDMYRPELADYSAIDRNRILWRITPDGDKARFRGDLVVVHNYRFFFGIDPANGQLRWAYNQPRVDAVSSDHTGGTIVFVTTEGEVGALDAATGRRVFTAQIPNAGQVRGATFDAEGFTADASAAPSPSPSLSSVLASIVWDPDRRFSDVKVFAIEQMAGQPGADVTADLLKIGQKDGLPPEAYQKAADALVERRDDAALEQFVAALRVHSDYAQNRQAHGVATLARAAASLKARKLAPALIEHLKLPETDGATVAQLGHALEAMSATEALPALRDFLSIYRADPMYEGDPGPLNAVAEAILALGGADDRKLLTFIAENPLTVDGLRAHLSRALAETAPAEPAAAPSPATKATPEAKAAAPAKE